MSLLSLQNAKTSKGEKTQGVLTGILYLVPHKLGLTLTRFNNVESEAWKYAGKNLCGSASEGCAAACLFTAGRGRMTNVMKGRLRKTILFHKDRKEFVRQLRADITKLVRKAKREGLVPAVRLNGTSDIPWHKVAPELFTEFEEVQFYDYTKHPVSKWGKLPSNYDLTLSRSEVNDPQARIALRKGERVAVVFKEVPKEWFGFDVIDGDEDDVRYNDPKGVVIGLKAKGEARKDTSGFVV